MRAKSAATPSPRARSRVVTTGLDHGAPPIATPSPPPIEVRADRIDGALDLSAVTLEGGVRARIGRVLVTAPMLRLRVKPDGTVDLVGPARITPCGCDAAPVSFAVERATLDADGGATLRGARVLLFGHTVLATPWLALRSERQLGLLAPTFAWRGADGPLVGAGVHVPLWDRAALELRPAAYVRGGAEVVGSLHTETSRLRARWDRTSATLFAVEAEGALPVREGAVVWDVDVIRGARARSGTIALDAAARVHDRAAGTFFFAPASASAGARWIAPRGVDVAAAGPRISIATSSSSDGVIATLAADASTLARGDGDAWHVLRVDADAAVSGFLGAIRGALDARLASAALVGPDRSALDGAVTLRPSAGLPLARSYGERVHVVEPMVHATTVLARQTSGARDGLLGPIAPIAGAAAAPGASIASRYGLPAGDAITADVGAGALVVDEARPIARAAATADTRWIRARAEAAALGRSGGLALGSLSLGRSNGLRALGGVESRTGVDPIAARTLAPGSLGPSSSWLGGEGTSARTELVVPIAPLTARAGASWDVGAGVRLEERAGLAYSHPCGCLALALLVSHRVGRVGPDATLSISLFP